MNLLRNWLFDEHFSTAVVPSQGQRDDSFGGTVDGSMAIAYGGSTTVVEVSHPFRSGDLRDTALTAGEKFGLSLFAYLKVADGRELTISLVPPTGAELERWTPCEVPHG